MRSLLFLGLLASSATWAATSPLTPTGASRIWFDGTSSVRSFTCEAKSFSARTGEQVARSVVEIPVTSLECGNKTMNQHMVKALDPSEPIRFRVTAYRATGERGIVKGNLSLHGETRPVTLHTAIRPGESEVRVAGKHRLLMTEYEVTPPTLMMGTMKVHPEVTVHFDLAFPREALEALAPTPQ
jgi:polyisoprenoid-binding protein YceI